MTHIVGFAGSLRKKSFNGWLLRAAEAFVPLGDTLEIVSIADIPLYSYDVEHEAFPESVKTMKERIVEADGLLIATPEYNNSIPGVAKNVIDWLTRPVDDADRVFENLPVAIMGTSPGRFGTALSQNAWLSVLRTLGTMPYFDGRLAIPHAGAVFDESGTIVDETVNQLLKAFVSGFFEFAAHHTRLRSASGS